MAKIQIYDQPRYITDEEVGTGRPVRSATWRDIADLINYLNRYACSVLPWTRWGQDVGLNSFSFVFPVSNPDYSTRYLTVVLANRPAEGALGLGTVTVTADSGDSDSYNYVSQSGGASGYAYTSEKGITYHVAQVAIEGASRELITVAGNNDCNFNGFGAWELPPIEGGAKAMSGPGINIGQASILDSISDVVDPADYMGDKDVDLNSLLVLQSSAKKGYDRNRRIIFNTAPAGNMDWNTQGSAIGNWVSLPQGGIYVPAYANTQAQHDAGYRTIRVAVKALNFFVGGTSQWRVETSQGNFNGTSWGGNVNEHWMPMDPGTGIYNRSTDGIQAQVDTDGEWIQIGLIDNNDGNSDPHIYQVIIWEDEP